MPYSRPNSKYLNLNFKLKAAARLMHAIYLFSMIHFQHPQYLYLGWHTFLCPILSSCLPSFERQTLSTSLGPSAARRPPGLLQEPGVTELPPSFILQEATAANTLYILCCTAGRAQFPFGLWQAQGDMRLTGLSSIVSGRWRGKEMARQPASGSPCHILHCRLCMAYKWLAIDPSPLVTSLVLCLWAIK